jgi:hypothetical protein
MFQKQNMAKPGFLKAFTATGIYGSISSHAKSCIFHTENTHLQI